MITMEVPGKIQGRYKKSRPTADRLASLLSFRGLNSKGSGRGTHLFLALSLCVSPPVSVSLSSVVSTYHG